ncbi:MAG: patatin-like phospholipase family protein [Actinomycetota bacterium]
MAHRWAELKGKAKGLRRGQTAFVFSGGGPLGAVQVGLLQALVDRSIYPDVVVGTSVGALNAVFMAAHPTNEGPLLLRDLWMHMRKDDLFPGGKLVSAWNVLKRGSYVFSNAGLRRLIENDLGIDDFEGLTIPAHIVATELATGEEKWFSSGPLVDPLLASAAMPGVFPPVVIEGETYIDGGVANNVPISKAVELGVKQVYVLNVNAAGQRRNLSRPHDFMMHGFVLARAHRYQREIAQVKRQIKVIEMPVVDVGHVSFTNMSQTQRLIDAGYEAGTAFLSGAASPETEDAEAFSSKIS